MPFGAYKICCVICIILLWFITNSCPLFLVPTERAVQYLEKETMFAIVIPLACLVLLLVITNGYLLYRLKASKTSKEPSENNSNTKAAINPKVSIPDKHFIAREKVVGSRETTDSVYMSLQRTNNSDKTYRQPVQQLAPNGRVNPALEGPRQPLSKGNYEIALVKHVNTSQRAVSSADYLEMGGSGTSDKSSHRVVPSTDYLEPVIRPGTSGTSPRRAVPSADYLEMVGSGTSDKLPHCTALFDDYEEVVGSRTSDKLPNRVVPSDDYEDMSSSVMSVDYVKMIA